MDPLLATVNIAVPFVMDASENEELEADTVLVELITGTPRRCV